MHARCMCSTTPLPTVHTAKELRPGTPGSRMGHGSWVIGMAWQKTLTCHCYSLHMLHTPPHHHGTTNRSDSIDRLDRPSISCFAFWMFEMMRRTKDSQNGMCPFLHKMPSHLHRPARIASQSIRTILDLSVTSHLLRKDGMPPQSVNNPYPQLFLATMHIPPHFPHVLASRTHIATHIQSLVRTKAHTYCHAICTHTRGSQDPKGFRQSGSTP